MSQFKLEKKSKETHQWEFVQKSEDKDILESMINFDDNNEWRIIENNEVTGIFSFGGHYEKSVFELNKPYKGINLLNKLIDSPYLKSRNYVVKNSFTSYGEKGTIKEIDRGKRISEVDPEKAISHDVFFECFDDGWIYLQILPFGSKDEITSLPYTLNSGDPLTVLKDLRGFVKEL